MDKQQQQQQQIVTECSPSFCACDPEAPRCQYGYENHTNAHWNDVGQRFHLDRVQQRIEASMQPAYRQHPTSMLRRRVMANRLLTEQEPSHSMLFRRRPQSLENSMLFRRQARALASQPFGNLIPEQSAVGPLQHLAAPQGNDQLLKDEELQCNHNIGFCISGDSNSDNSLEQSRKQQRQS